MSNSYKESFPICYETANKNKDKAISSRNVFHTILSLGGIHTPYRSDSLSIVSPLFVETKRYYLNDHNQPKPFDDFCQCSWLIVHPRHHTADVDELPADMMSFRAGIANLFAPSKKESIFTGIMNMPMKHIAVFIIISPMKRDEVMAHNYMLAAVGDFLYRCDILKIPFGGLTEFSGIMIAANQNFSAVEPFKKGWPL